MIIFLVILFGLIVGSFFNALVYRMGHSESVVKGRSKCVHCKHVLGVLDLIPVLSFFLLKRKCRYCNKNISWQYPIVEVVTALIFVSLYISFGLTADFYFAALVTLFLVPIFLTDLYYYLIPDSICITGIIVIFCAQLYRGVDVINLIIASAIAGGFFLIQYLISKGKWIGAGDIALGILMGVTLGFPNIVYALGIAYVAGAIVGLLLIAFGKKKMKSEMPLGTFLSFVTFVVLILK